MIATCQQLEKKAAASQAATARVALVVEYDGTRYHGSQLQASQPTIQGELEAALASLTGEKLRLQMASRTDAGVHAEGQVASFRTGSTLPLAAFVNGLNYYLPADIAVKAAFRADDALDVRRHAASREYKYYILNSPTRSPLREGTTYRVSGHLDTTAMNRACQALVGRHDFASFITGAEAGKKSTVRHIYRAETAREGDTVTLSMEANSFLSHQVRNTAGALIQVGLGKMTIAEFRDIVAARKPGLAGPTAPACGLFLTRINYPAPLGETTR